MAHIENRGDRSFLRSLHRSTSGFLKKNKRLFEFEKTLIDFFKTNLSKRTNTADMKKQYSGLKADLHRINKQFPEKHTQNYFDFLTWIDSKTENISFAAAARRKSKHNTGK
jgi:hypothetical protein